MATRTSLRIDEPEQATDGAHLPAVRRDDLRAIACILGTGVEAAPQKLAELGLAFQG